MINFAHIGETALLIIIAYLLGCILGYATRRVLHAARGTRQVTTEMRAQVAEPPPQQRKPRSYAARLAATVNDMPDPATAPNVVRLHPPARPIPHQPTAGNLKQIKGIGPKIEASLNALGIFHMHQVAAWSWSDIDRFDVQLGLKGRIRREQWVEQARQMVQASA